jgi:hypothetical protein
LGGADLRSARLKGADLSGVHLHGARNLTLEQLSAARALIPAEKGSSQVGGPDQRTEDITMAAEAYEVVEERETR